MNIALIIAGGVGQRTNQDIPKQFINVNDKPVIIYTLEAFQKHEEIDAIEVVCLDGWHDILSAYAKQFNITKLKKIVSGGDNGQSSIRNGVYSISEKYSQDDMILVHDAIRPMVSEEIISDCIKTCKEYGSAITSIPCAEAMLYSTDKLKSDKIISRDELLRTQTPQAFTVGKLKSAHEEALKKGITNSVASCTLMIELGERVYFSKGSEKNIKLTTAEDFEIFRALLTAKNADWFK
ncbi:MULTISPECIES: IspD/TarI family cytidylyltransferase [Clostridium]|uniref:IspD/TarI family cytidylyltransferase n=1 Tax=Clostridium TaxID=1485 RepID=UPI000C067FF2|nr:MULTISPECIES: IspD/TarI family cytidylyltransferase [Clostridium]MBS4958723.1 2-C-methyl-D-erythritol 4-phosphate cytidylyltransferase [Clostridium sp.]MDB1941159.1 IspD/TarI family cytidylyltransferase [Clostridium tertium]MDU2157227.1 IspD/TarI family cytidylyltransferase [Clostridium sp.]MDU3525432.1 IspD/TarI family cytidylyltransferase [Clostridium sp.]MDU3548915.1 IspD/TarI family cytidylyltransferase [Clostridium sp.]